MWCLLYVVFIALYYNSYCEHIRIDQARCRSAPRVFCENSFCSGEEKGGSPDPPPPPPPRAEGSWTPPLLRTGIFSATGPLPPLIHFPPPLQMARQVPIIGWPLWATLATRLQSASFFSLVRLPPPPPGNPRRGSASPLFFQASPEFQLRRISKLTPNGGRGIRSAYNAHISHIWHISLFFIAKKRIFLALFAHIEHAF